MPKTLKAGPFRVPVKLCYSQDAELLGNPVRVDTSPGLTLVKFSGGEHGKKEKGLFAFWCCYGTDKYGDWKVWGRAYVDLPATDRFSRMEDEMVSAAAAESRKAYGQMVRLYKRTKTGMYIVPCTVREVVRWLESHQKDAEHAELPALIRGKLYKRLPRDV